MNIIISNEFTISRGSNCLVRELKTITIYASIDVHVTFIYDVLGHRYRMKMLINFFLKKKPFQGKNLPQVIKTNITYNFFKLN